jgi:hypothetical protein
LRHLPVPVPVRQNYASQALQNCLKQTDFDTDLVY